MSAWSASRTQGDLDLARRLRIFGEAGGDRLARVLQHIGQCLADNAGVAVGQGPARPRLTS